MRKDVVSIKEELKKIDDNYEILLPWVEFTFKGKTYSEKDPLFSKFIQKKLNLRNCGKMSVCLKKLDDLEVEEHTERSK